MGILSKVLKPVSSIISNVLDPVGGALNSLTGVSNTAEQSYNYSTQLANQQQANNIALWNMQNEYNTPAAQIARLSQAGIDVNPMTFAVGNGNMSSTAQNISPATYHAPNFGSPGNPIAMAMEVMSGIKGLERQDRENQLLQKDIENYEHNHANPYKDLISFLASKFSDVDYHPSGSPGSSKPGNFWIKGRSGKPLFYRGFLRKDGKIDLGA